MRINVSEFKACASKWANLSADLQIASTSQPGNGGSQVAALRSKSSRARSVAPKRISTRPANRDKVVLRDFSAFQTLVNNPVYTNDSVEDVVDGYQAGGYVALIAHK